MATAGSIATPTGDGPAFNPEITDSINETRKSIEDLIAEISTIGSDINGNYLAEFSRGGQYSRSGSSINDGYCV